MCFHWFCLRRGENDQEHAASMRGNGSNEEGLFMYAIINGGFEGGFSENLEHV